VKEDEYGCLSAHLPYHLGRFKQHDEYANKVTGSSGNFLIIRPDGMGKSFDGRVRSSGRQLSMASVLVEM
jgi:hypothetical protein